jgi:hypothetical protein
MQTHKCGKGSGAAPAAARARTAFAGLAAVAAGALAVGCAADAPDRTAWVLLDLSARTDGVQLEIDGVRVASAVPVAVDTGAEVATIGPSGRMRLPVRAGELRHVFGSEGVVETGRVGGDLRADALWADGPERAARTLAEWTGASVAARADGLWELTGPDVLASAAAAGDPDGLVEVFPVPAPEGSDAATRSGAAASTAATFDAWAALLAPSRYVRARDASRRLPSSSPPPDGSSLPSARALAPSALTSWHAPRTLVVDLAGTHAAGEATGVPSAAEAIAASDAEADLTRLVGAYRTAGGYLVLDAAGRFSGVEGGRPAEGGRWRLKDGRLVLQAATGATRPLAIEADGVLRGDDGGALVPDDGVLRDADGARPGVGR